MTGGLELEAVERSRPAYYGEGLCWIAKNFAATDVIASGAASYNL